MIPFTIMAYSCHRYLEAPTACEQLFSNIRTKIYDEHFENSLEITSTTSIEPNIEELVSQKQCQISH